MAQRPGVTALPRFDGPRPWQWLAQITSYYASWGFEDYECLEEAPGFLPCIIHWWSIEDYAPELRLEDWEWFSHLMLESFSGQTVGSTIAKLQSLRYHRKFERLPEHFADILAEGDRHPDGLTLDVFLSRFQIEMVKPVLEEEFSNWVQATENLGEIKDNKQE